MLSDKSSQALPYNDLVTHTTFGGTAQQISQPYRAKDLNPSLAALPPSRSDRTMEQIKSYMLNLDLRPGDPLPTEAKLCETLGVSRSSVREALRKLEALDIVESHRGSGSFVGKMTLEPLVETLLLRTALDSSQGGEIVHNITQIRVALDLGVADQVVNAMAGTSNPHLYELVKEMQEKTARGMLFPDEDIAFHEAMLGYLNNEVIVELMRSMWFVHQTLLPKLNLHAAPTKENMLITARAHGDMLAAAEAGDYKAYLAAVELHYKPINRLLAGIKLQ